MIKRTIEFMSDGVELNTLLGCSDKDFMESRRVTWDDVMHSEDRARVHTEVLRWAATRVAFCPTAHSLAYRIISATKQTKYVRDCSDSSTMRLDTPWPLRA